MLVPLALAALGMAVASAGEERSPSERVPFPGFGPEVLLQLMPGSAYYDIDKCFGHLDGWFVLAWTIPTLLSMRSAVRSLLKTPHMDMECRIRCPVPIAWFLPKESLSDQANKVLMEIRGYDLGRHTKGHPAYFRDRVLLLKELDVLLRRIFVPSEPNEAFETTFGIVQTAIGHTPVQVRELDEVKEEIRGALLSREEYATRILKPYYDWRTPDPKEHKEILVVKLWDFKQSYMKKFRYGERCANVKVHWIYEVIQEPKGDFWADDSVASYEIDDMLARLGWTPPHPRKKKDGGEGEGGEEVSVDDLMKLIGSH